MSLAKHAEKGDTLTAHVLKSGTMPEDSKWSEEDWILWRANVWAWWWGPQPEWWNAPAATEAPEPPKTPTAKKGIPEAAPAGCPGPVEAPAVEAGKAPAAKADQAPAAVTEPPPKESAVEGKAVSTGDTTESPSPEPAKSAPKKGASTANNTGRKSTSLTSTASKKATLPQPLGKAIPPAKFKPPEPKGPPPKRAKVSEGEAEYEDVNVDEETWYNQVRKSHRTEVKQEIQEDTKNDELTKQIMQQLAARGYGDLYVFEKSFLVFHV